MGNAIKDLIYSIHAGLSVAEHQGDVRRLQIDLIDLEALIARIKDEPELLEGFEADGLASAYRANGYLWCACQDDWRHPGDMACGCVNDPDLNPPGPVAPLPERIAWDGPADVDWMAAIRQLLNAGELSLPVYGFGVSDPDAQLLWAWRWIETLELAWGEMPRDVSWRLVRPVLEGYDERFFTPLHGVIGKAWPRVGVSDPLLWAECARLAEVDAREVGDPYLVELAQEMGREIAAMYAGAGAFERGQVFFGKLSHEWREAAEVFGAHFDAGVRALFGRYHEWDRDGAAGGWTNRIGDLGNDTGWAVSIIDWHKGEIGTWHLLARIIAARALRLARQWYHDEREIFERLGMDEFDVAPRLYGVGLEDSLRRLLCAGARARGWA
jgi:hypothetical protein